MVSDNGPQFTAGEFKDLVKRFELEHIRIRSNHPESNGTLERFHRSTDTERTSS
jgi:transposase InsO family protein